MKLKCCKNIRLLFYMLKYFYISRNFYPVIKISFLFQEKGVAAKSCAKSDGPSCGQLQSDSTTPASALSLPQPMCNLHVCVKLCSLIKAQLVQAHAEVTRRFGGNQVRRKMFFNNI